MDDEEPPPTLEEQFFSFANFNEPPPTKNKITLRKSDIWLFQAEILDERKVKLTDTGYLFNKFTKWSLTFEEFEKYLEMFCTAKGFNLEDVKESLIMCGPPGSKNVFEVPHYSELLLEDVRRAAATTDE